MRKTKTSNKALFNEARRFLSALADYDNAADVNHFHCPEHAAAMRASMDLYHALAQWRQTSPYDKLEKK